MPKLRHEEGEKLASLIAEGAHPGEAYTASGLPACKDPTTAARRYRKNHPAIDARIEELRTDQEQLSMLRKEQAEKLTVDYIKSKLYRTIEVSSEEVDMYSVKGALLKDEHGEPLKKIKDATSLMKALEKAGTLHNLFPASSQSLQIKATIDDLSDAEKRAKINAAAALLSTVAQPEATTEPPKEITVGTEGSLGSGGDGEVQPALELHPVSEADGVPRRWKN